MEAEATVNDREQTLIKDCLDGQIDSFGELIQPYQDRLFNTLFRLLGRREEAAELLQDAMIRAFKGLRSYNGDSSFYTWLYRISVNVAITSRRKRRLKLYSTEDALDDGVREPADTDDRTRPGHRIEEQERHQLIQEALDSIPENYRAVIVLKDIEGLKYEEISEILDIPVGTVRSRLHRARGEMRDKLKPKMDEGLL